MEIPNDLNRFQTPRKDLVFKFLVVGDYGVGKFSSNYKITIGADFSVKTIQWDANTRVSLQLWDIAGHERFGYMTRVYYKYATGCAVAFDITRYSSFQSVPKWLSDVQDKLAFDDGGEIPVILLANKWDIGENCLSDEAISKFATQNGFKAWFNTSAKTNLNIDDAMNCLIGGAITLSKGGKTYSSSNTIDICSGQQKNRKDVKKNKCCT